jgi:hypothetical protein
MTVSTGSQIQRFTGGQQKATQVGQLRASSPPSPPWVAGRMFSDEKESKQAFSGMISKRVMGYWNNRPWRKTIHASQLSSKLECGQGGITQLAAAPRSVTKSQSITFPKPL